MKAKIFTALTLLGAATVQADSLPLVRTYDPLKPSEDYVAMVSKPGSATKVRAEIRNFGITDAQEAQEAGRQLVGLNLESSVMAEMMRQKGLRLYHDEFFARCYVQEARKGFFQAIHSIK